MVTVGTRSSEPESRSRPRPVASDPNHDIHDDVERDGLLPYATKAIVPSRQSLPNEYIHPAATNGFPFPASARSQTESRPPSNTECVSVS